MITHELNDNERAMIITKFWAMGFLSPDSAGKLNEELFIAQRFGHDHDPLIISGCPRGVRVGHPAILHYAPVGPALPNSQALRRPEIYK